MEKKALPFLSVVVKEEFLLNAVPSVCFKRSYELNSISEYLEIIAGKLDNFLFYVLIREIVIGQVEFLSNHL